MPMRGQSMQIINGCRFPGVIAHCSIPWFECVDNLIGNMESALHFRTAFNRHQTEPVPTGNWEIFASANKTPRIVEQWTNGRNGRMFSVAWISRLMCGQSRFAVARKEHNDSHLLLWLWPKWTDSNFVPKMAEKQFSSAARTNGERRRILFEKILYWGDEFANSEWEKQ